MSAPLPTALNLVFHGPWGFVLDTAADTLTAYTPECAQHLYFLGDTPLLNAWPPGLYHFQDEDAVGGLPQPPPSPPQTLVRGAVVPPRLPAAPAKLRAVRLPRTALHVGRRAQRTPPDGAGGDNLLVGADFGRLNCADPGRPVYLAVNQVLPYALHSFSDLGLVSAAGLAWRPALNFSTGRASVNLHLFAQAVSPSSHDHFAMMAALFHLDLRLGGSQAKTAGTDCDPNLPPGVTPEDLGDLGGKPTPPNGVFTPLLPLICGGNLVMTAG
ncbi:MAG TPA: hypothetical protein VNF74_05050 [Terriglobales bacterium]|nr:hypothetical protein [Terriglobales bacterium]